MKGVVRLGTKMRRKITRWFAVVGLAIVIAITARVYLSVSAAATSRRGLTPFCVLKEGKRFRAKFSKIINERVDDDFARMPLAASLLFISQGHDGGTHR